MRLGFLGGSFDPPHRGHLAMAEAAVRAVHLHAVLLAPTGLQPFKRNGAVASFEDRLRMVEALCAEDGSGRLRASAVDAAGPDGQPNYTIDTLERLRAAWPEAELFGILGADSFAAMGTWRGPEQLMERARWVVISRPGCALPERLEAPLRADRVVRVEDVAVPWASHVLRERLRAGESCAEAIPEGVLAVIRERGLYGTRQDHGGGRGLPGRGRASSI